jgi:hypothetical protein
MYEALIPRLITFLTFLVTFDSILSFVRKSDSNGSNAYYIQDIFMFLFSANHCSILFYWCVVELSFDGHYCRLLNLTYVLSVKSEAGFSVLVFERISAV